MPEVVIATVKAWRVNTTGSKVVVIPKKAREMLGEEATTHFIVKINDKNRLIYEPILKERKGR